MLQFLMLSTLAMPAAAADDVNLTINDITTAPAWWGSIRVTVAVENTGTDDAIGVICVDVFKDWVLPMPDLGDWSDLYQCISTIPAETEVELEFYTMPAVANGWWIAIVDTDDFIVDETSETDNRYFEFKP